MMSELTLQTTFANKHDSLLSTNELLNLQLIKIELILIYKQLYFFREYNYIYIFL